ncbi:hypothetical protein Tsubulata_010133, partial [Turnera subulata]
MNVHAQIQVSGLQQDSFLLSELIRLSSLSPFKNLRYAQSLLYHSINSAPSSWNILIRGYSPSDTPSEAIWVFRRMRRRGLRPSNLTFPFVLKACASSSALQEGKQVHVDVFKFGLDGDVMRDGGLKKLGGESCVELDGSIHRFFSGYNSEDDQQGIYQLLDELNLHMRMIN